MTKHNVEHTDTPDRRALAQNAADALARDCPGHANVERGSMFGSEGLKVGGKFFAFVEHDGELTLKLPATQAATLIARGDATPLQLGPRTMREWVVRPASTDEDAGRRRDLLGEAYRYVSTLTRTDVRRT